MENFFTLFGGKKEPYMRRSHRKLGNAFAFSFSFSGRFGDSGWPEAVFNTHIISFTKFNQKILKIR